MNSEAIRRLLELLPILEQPGFEIADWPKLPERFDANGRKIVQMPYPEYRPIVDDLRERIAAALDGMDIRQTLPEDPIDKAGTYAKGQPIPPRAILHGKSPLVDFERSTKAQILRYLGWAMRGEYDSDGHIDEQFKSGALVAALRRLSELGAEMSD